MRVAAAVALALAVATPAVTQEREASLQVTVADQTGAVIPGAQVRLETLGVAGSAREAVTDERGVARFDRLPPGRYGLTAGFAGFEDGRLADFRVRPGTTKREVRLPIARLAEDVQVGQDARNGALDPRGNAFATVLTPDQIAALPDDPDEMEAALKQMAGPGATIRVDGFRGGKLPPKSQIRGIRFRRDMFAAENHGGGLVMVDVTTAPGAGPLRGSLDFTFRDESLNARHPLAPERGAEQQQNYGVSLNGTLIKDRTSFSFTTNGRSAYDSQNIFAAVPGATIADTVRRPTGFGTLTARIDHALTTTQTLKASFQNSRSEVENLGVGDFNLVSRGYSRTTDQQLFRTLLTGPIGRSLYAESRLQVSRQSSATTALTEAPALVVLDAFSSGGAQLGGARQATTWELASDVDYAVGRHAARFGILLEGGHYRSDEASNTGGTFTFASLDAYEAGRPSTYTRRDGNPLVSYAAVQAGWYAQDDIRLARSLALSVGLRQELQAHLGDGLNLAPRVGLTWSPFKSGVTTVRGGAGIFYDWYEPAIYEQTLRVDGVNQVDLAVLNPGYPDPLAGGDVAVLPSGRILQAPGMILPSTTRASIGVEQALGRYSRLTVMTTYARGREQLRGRNTNAPGVDGQRPDPAAGIVTQIESTARSEARYLNLGYNLSLPWHRLFLFANYTLGRAMNDADGALSLPADSRDPRADWGPAPGDARHRLSALLTMRLWSGFALSTNLSGSSGLPYNITTGFDDNGDTVSNDRPAGVGRNGARGGGRWDVGGRLSWAFGFGARDTGGPTGGPMIVVRQANGETSMSGFSGGAEDKRWRIELFLAGTNLLNHTNLSGYSGVLTSPFFATATAAGAPRKLEVGMRFGF